MGDLTNDTENTALPLRRSLEPCLRSKTFCMSRLRAREYASSHNKTHWQLMEMSGVEGRGVRTRCGGMAIYGRGKAGLALGAKQSIWYSYSL